MYRNQLLRKEFVKVNNPATGAASSAVTVTGTIVPNGRAVEVAWGTHPVNPPTAGWTGATTSGGNWSLGTTRPTPAGTYYLHARSQRYKANRVASSPVVVT